MTQLQFLRDWIEWMEIVVFWVSALAPIITSFFWKWWMSIWGWNIISLEVCIFGLLLRPAIHLTFGISGNPSSIPWAWEQAILFTCIAPLIIWRTVVIYHTQRSGANLGSV